MIDSKIKGSRAELAARDILRKYTELDWQRVPSSGALNVAHKLKGDLYIPEVNNKYCIEVKHYAKDQISTKLLTDKAPIFSDWWVQTASQAEKVNKLPLLLFKHDRSKWFVAFDGIINKFNYKILIYNNIYIAKLEDWLIHEDPEFINE